MLAYEWMLLEALGVAANVETFRAIPIVPASSKVVAKANWFAIFI
jgi:hypothetical protein